MAKQKITDFLFYRWRYLIGYAGFAVALALLLVIAGLFIPGGLSKTEIASALLSDNLDPTKLFTLDASQLLYLPYRLLQAASFSLFGFTTFSIKLPSLILAFLSAVGMLVLLNTWFKHNVALVTSIISVTTTHFILTAQSGQAGITYIFWTVCILLAASLIANKAAISKIWVVVGFVLAALSLYMPLNVYVLLALVLTALLHPHARHTLIRQASRPALAIGTILFLVVISPLIVGIVYEPSLLKTLFGIPDDWAMVGENSKTIFSQYINVYATSSGSVIQPVYGLGTLLLMLLGVYRLFTTKYTTKSYVISFWMFFLVPLVFLNPQFISITFVPAILLLALGVDYLVWSWYRLFPRNPYARIFGLLPLGVFVIGVAAANIDRYAYGYHYDSTIYSDFSFDLNSAQKAIKNLDNKESLQLVVSQQDKPLFDALAAHQTDIKSLTVTTSTVQALKSKQQILVARGLETSISSAPDSVIVTTSSKNADRFYFYKNSTN